MSKHVHAELMAQYAQDALETDRPWQRWEVRCTAGWYSLTEHPNWSDRLFYRRKPTQIRVAGEVFDDVIAYHERDTLKCAWVVGEGTVDKVGGSNLVSEYEFRQGLVHTTYEGALRHLEALKPKVL